MIFNVKKLQDQGFHVEVNNVDGSIKIYAPSTPEATWREMKDRISDRVGDPGLQEYVLGAYLIALERAMILELAE